MSGNHADLFAEINKRFGHIPPSLRWMITADGIFHPDDADTEGSRSFLNVWTETQDDVVVGVAGGTYLEHATPKEKRFYYHLNRRLADIFVQQPTPNGKIGWSFVTGQGPGKAMAGPHFCLKNAREAIDEAIECISKCIGVPSGLGDETAHKFADPMYTVRKQVDTLIREMMLVALSRNGLLVYPGYKGTLFELALALFLNYCAGRSEAGLPPFPVVIVDLPNNIEQNLEFGHGSYFGFVPRYTRDAERIGVAKSGTGNGVQIVDVTWDNAPEIIWGHIQQGLRTHHNFAPDYGREE